MQNNNKIEVICSDIDCFAIIPLQIISFRSIWVLVHNIYKQQSSMIIAKRRHSHKRSSSTSLQQPEVATAGTAIFVSEINCLQTMKLLQQSQNKCEYQVIVESITDLQGNGSNTKFQDRQINQNPNGDAFSPFFQIEQNKYADRQDKAYLVGINPNPSVNQPKVTIRSKLHYHRNVKLKVCTLINSSHNYSKDGTLLNDAIYCSEIQA